MNDTPKPVRAIVHGMMMERSPEERLSMGAGMHEAARSIALASFPCGESSSEQRYRLFMRFYSRDFDNQAKERIRDRLIEVRTHGNQEPQETEGESQDDQSALDG